MNVMISVYMAWRMGVGSSKLCSTFQTFVMNEYLKDTICLMSTPGGGSSSNPYGSTLPAPSNSASGTNTTNSISSTTNSAPTNSGSSNSVTTSNDLVRVTVDKNYPSKNCFTGHYTDKE